MPRTSLLGDVVVELSDIDSTNNYAMRLINEGMAEHGMAIRADRQTQGKGQHGNVWQAEEGKNLLLSVILDTQGFQIQNQFYLNATACIALSELLMTKYGLREIAIKWPNDIYAGNRKVAGILIENNIRGNDWTNAVIGIGLNVNQVFFPDLNRATSIQIELEREVKVSQVMKLFFSYFNTYFKSFGKNDDVLLELYNQRLYRIQKEINFYKNHEMYQGVLERVTPDGQIEIRMNGKVKSFRHKEIEFILD